MRTQAKDLLSYPTYWAECFGIAPYLPMSRAEMDELGWDSCDIILVTNDAYTPNGEAGKRPDRSMIVYSQRIKEAYKDTPIVIGGIGASLRRHS